MTKVYNKRSVCGGTRVYLKIPPSSLLKMVMEINSLKQTNKQHPWFDGLNVYNDTIHWLEASSKETNQAQLWWCT